MAFSTSSLHGVDADSLVLEVAESVWSLRSQLTPADVRKLWASLGAFVANCMMAHRVRTPFTLCLGVQKRERESPSV